MSLNKLYRTLRYGEPIILVSGLPRSGTSMLMKMLEAGGLEVVTDNIRTADEDNPKGYYEFEKVKDLDKGGDKSWVKDLRGKVVKIISFLLKDLPEDNNYKIIFILRNIDEVLASQQKMLKRRGEEGGGVPDDKMKENFKDHLWKVKYLLSHNSRFDTLFVEHQDAIKDPQRVAQKVSDFFSGKLDVDKMMSVVDPKLYRNRAQ